MTSFDDVIAKFNTVKDLISTTIVRGKYFIILCVLLFLVEYKF